MSWQKTVTVVVTMILIVSGQQISAEQVTKEQAQRIAANWLTLVIETSGDWGGAKDATIADVVEFTREDRLLGYYCPVDPHGYIIVSLFEGLAPTKAYSETSELNLDKDNESTDLVRRQMESLLDIAEARFGPLTTVSKEQLSVLVGYNHVNDWAILDVDTNVFMANFPRYKSRDDYQEGAVLLTSCWNQYEPYNLLCPPADPEVCLDHAHCATGCVATAAAQIVRYWSWPPGRDWKNMPDTLQETDPPVQINATAELNRAIGDALDLVYCNGKCGTSYSPSDGTDIEMFFQGWAYGDECTWSWRRDYNGYDWFLLFIEDLDRNRPIQYRMVGHQIVCDGYYWLPYPHYHMNWGHGGSNNAWFALDTLPRPDPEYGLYWDYIIHRICPHGYLGPVVSGVYPYNPSYSWRYVDRDCQGASAQFASGNLIGFLPYMVMGCNSGFLRFDGQPALHTRLFCPDISRGIVVQDGSIVMHPRGSIRFALRRP